MPISYLMVLRTTSICHVDLTKILFAISRVVKIILLYLSNELNINGKDEILR